MLNTASLFETVEIALALPVLPTTPTEPKESCKGQQLTQSFFGFTLQRVPSSSGFQAHTITVNCMRHIYLALPLSQAQSEWKRILVSPSFYI